MTKKEFSLDIGGKTLTATFTDLAEQANGSVLLRYGDTTVLATAVMGKKDKSDIDYFPLTVDYEERFYAAGKILGSRYIRREGRPSEEAILSGRVVDRTIRPLFDMRIRTDVQVVVTVLSIDEDDPDVLGIIAASLALGTSDIPWNGPVSAVRIGKSKGAETLETNPTYSARKAEDAELDLLVCGKENTITMTEVGAKEVPENVLEGAFTEGISVIEKIQKFQNEVIAEIGKKKKEIKFPEQNAQIPELFKEFEPEFESEIFSGVPGKESIEALKTRWLMKIAETMPAEVKHAEHYWDDRVEKLMDKRAIDEKKRVDGRQMDELRPLFAQAGGVSPILHGSGIFYRGGTHVFSALTLGGPED